MLRHQRGSAPDRPPAPPTDEPADRGRSLDAVHLRNYDHRRAHSAHVTVTDAAGRLALRERCYLAPGQSRRLRVRAAPGEHRVRVRVDGVERLDGRFGLDGTPAGTAVVELGNGVVSATEGADGLADG